MSLADSFYELDPNRVYRALDKLGYRSTGKYWQLNSYENRVFDIEVEDKNSQLSRIIIKFYRPGRWSKECILEEHDFLRDLKSEGIFVAAPLVLPSGSTVQESEGLFFSIFPRIQGRMTDELLDPDLVKIGRALAQIHNVGARKKFVHRPSWKMPQRGLTSLKVLKSFVAGEVWSRYQTAGNSIIDCLTNAFKKIPFIRIHGDCHKGNILNNGKEFFFVDFDDSGTGPAVQDIWMLLGSDEEERSEAAENLLMGYTEFREFDEQTLVLCEPLRGLRILNYSAWIAQRWQDPSFLQLFPDFTTYNWWAEEVERLEQIAWTITS